MTFFFLFKMQFTKFSIRKISYDMKAALENLSSLPQLPQGVMVKIPHLVLH